MVEPELEGPQDNERQGGDSEVVGSLGAKLGELEFRRRGLRSPIRHEGTLSGSTSERWRAGSGDGEEARTR